MAGGAGHAGVGEYRTKVCAVMLGRQPCRLEVRGSDLEAGAAWICGRVAAWWSYVGTRGSERVEKYSRGGGGIVRGHRVVDEVHEHGVVERDSSSVPTGDVIGENVVGDRDSVPISRSAGEALHVGSVNVLQFQAAAAAFFRGIALDQVSVNHEAGTSAIAKPRGAIKVGYCAALGARRSVRRSPIWRRTLDHNTTAVGSQRRVEALVEDE